MTGTGRRNQRITFERATFARGELGGKGPTRWDAIGTARWAAVFIGTGSERRENAVEKAVQAATFNLLPDAMTLGITVKDRIVWGGLTWDIAGIFPVGFGPREIEFTCLASRG